MSDQIFFFERIDSPTGELLIVTDADDRLRSIDWEDHEGRMNRLLERHYGPMGFRLEKAGRASAARRALERYFVGELEALADVETLTNGTEFQKLVWAELRRIPVGETISYGTLAGRIGRPAAARAVGMANGANPIPIVVPCHRVIGANDKLVGFGGGLERKRWLLGHERAAFQLPHAA
jgi:methylated-DNA-[protein]-cysteine S-methyltransferase